MTYPVGILNIENKLEQDVAILLHNLGFDFVRANLEIKSKKEILGEIDLLFTYDKTLFLIEVSEGRHNITNKKNTFFTKWENQVFLGLVRKEIGFSNKQILKIYFDFSTETVEDESASVITLLKDTKNSIISYKDDFAYFLNSFMKIGQWARNDFLNWASPEQNKHFDKINAIQYYIQDIPVYCFVANVKVLLNSCYVQRRRRTNQNVGYQRMLDGRRTASIKQNIESSRGLSFPNSILIQSEKLSENIFPKEQCPKPIVIDFPTNFCSCRIIDGQHRLLGFSKLDSKQLDQHFLTVVALPEIGPRKEFTTFIDINSKQQKMDNNLILNLKADWDWPDNSSERKEQKCVNVAKKLNEKILKDKIYFGTADETKKGKITLVTIKSTLFMNNQILSTEDEMFKKISKIYRNLGETIPEHTSSDGFFQQNQGFRFLFRLVNLFERNREAGKININQIDFFKDVKSIMSPTFLEQIKEHYGTGSGGSAANDLIVELKDKFPKKYERIEEDLKKLKIQK